jgi:hypothetical protein
MQQNMTEVCAAAECENRPANLYVRNKNRPRDQRKYYLDNRAKLIAQSKERNQRISKELIAAGIVHIPMWKSMPQEIAAGIVADRAAGMRTCELCKKYSVPKYAVYSIERNWISRSDRAEIEAAINNHSQS